jgi:hypothetical protein
MVSAVRSRGWRLSLFINVVDEGVEFSFWSGGVTEVTQAITQGGVYHIVHNHVPDVRWGLATFLKTCPEVEHVSAVQPSRSVRFVWFGQAFRGSVEKPQGVIVLPLLNQKPLLVHTFRFPHALLPDRYRW